MTHLGMRAEPHLSWNGKSKKRHRSTCGHPKCSFKSQTNDLIQKLEHQKQTNTLNGTFPQLIVSFKLKRSLESFQIKTGIFLVSIVWDFFSFHICCLFCQMLQTVRFLGLLKWLYRFMSTIWKLTTATTIESIAALINGNSLFNKIHIWDTLM